MISTEKHAYFCIEIHTFAYQYSRKTPTKVIPHKNIIVRLCNIECSWAKSILDSASLWVESDYNTYKHRDLLKYPRVFLRSNR